MATTWNAKEREVIEPFQLARDAFGGAKLRWSEQEDFDSGEVRLIESRTAWEVADPAMLVVVDRDTAVRETGVPAEDLGVALSIRDRQLNLFRLVDQWKLCSVPDVPVPLRDPLRLFSCGSHMELCLSLFVSRTSNRGFRVAKERGQILARKSFVVRPLPELPRFPKIWKAPVDFERKGLHEDTIFYVEWLAEDLDRPPAEALTIWLNEQYRDQILSFEHGGSSGRLIVTELAGMILAEVCAAVLASEQVPDDPDGTIEVVGRVLQDVTGSTLDEMRMRMVSHDGFSWLRAWCQQAVGVTELMRTLDFFGGDG
jgi:hypothetical protein